MALTVGEILNMEEFREYRVLCGKRGLAQEVSNVTVMDTPNPQEWTRPGELVVSSGFILQQNVPDLVSFVRKLAQTEACALFLKLGAYLPQLSDEVIAAANEMAFPIVSMPVNCAIADIINPILKKLIDVQSSAIRLSENISTSFINTVINGGGISDIVNTISTLLNQNIAFYDVAFNKIYPSKNASLCEDFKDSFSLLYPHLRVTLEDKDYGFIVIIDDKRQELSDYETMILSHASTALKLIAQKYISNMEIESRYRDGFVQDIVLNNIKSLQEVIKRGKIYGWDLSEKYYTTVIVEYYVLTKRFSSRNSLSSSQGNGISNPIPGKSCRFPSGYLRPVKVRYIRSGKVCSRSNSSVSIYHNLGVRTCNNSRSTQ